MLSIASARCPPGLRLPAQPGYTWNLAHFQARHKPVLCGVNRVVTVAKRHTIQIDRKCTNSASACKVPSHRPQPLSLRDRLHLLFGTLLQESKSQDHQHAANSQLAMWPFPRAPTPTLRTASNPQLHRQMESSAPAKSEARLAWPSRTGPTSGITRKLWSSRMAGPQGILGLYGHFYRKPSSFLSVSGRQQIHTSRPQNKTVGQWKQASQYSIQQLKWFTVESRSNE